MKPPSTRPAALLALIPVLVVALAGACRGEGERIQEPSPVALVRITAPTTSIRVGDTVQLTASAIDADGNVLERTFRWTSGIGTVASVTSNGLVTGLVKGSSQIRATIEDVTGTLVIRVEVAPRPEALTVGPQ